MQNPFEEINARLNHLEALIVSVKQDLNSYDELIVNGVINVLNSVKQEPTQPEPSKKYYLNSAEAADYLGVNSKSIYQYIYKIPSVKKDGKLYFLNTDLDAYLRRNDVKRTPKSALTRGWAEIKEGN
jgi:hypothetical protein